MGNEISYSSDNRYYIHLSDADIPMDSNQLQMFFENPQDTYSRWEEIETEFGVENINEDLLLDMIHTANETDRMQYVY